MGKFFVSEVLNFVHTKYKLLSPAHKTQVTCLLWGLLQSTNQ